ncbi:MAG: ATP synthase subunit I [Caldimonas sp.]
MAATVRWTDADDADDRQYKRLTREEAEALRVRNPVLSPWRVIAAQAALGLAIAGAARLISGSLESALSALYGAAVVVLPGALMARGTTSRMSRLTPATSAVSMMFWALLKIAASVLMLVLAPRAVQPLSWPALLVAMVLCMQVYWFALLWRGRSKN